jgi:hypothetical protein
LPGKRALQPMHPATRRTQRPRALRPVLAAAALLLAAAPAAALEFFDGKIQIHGFYEMQTRVLAQSYDTVDGYNLAQWWHIANVEVEWDAAPEGWGPFDYVSGFLRVEARYDCVWTSGCQVIPGYHSRYGNDAQRLPDRISNARKYGLIASIDPFLVERDPDTGEVTRTIDYADRRRRIRGDLDERSIVYGAERPETPGGVGGLEVGNMHPHRVGSWWHVPVFSEFFFPSPGPDDVWGTADDPGFYTLENFLDYRFALKRLEGNIGGISSDVLGPYRPRDQIPLPGALRDRANPFRGPCPTDAAGMPVNDPSVCDLRPAQGTPGDPDFLPPIPGATALPFRPAPDVAFAQDGVPDAGFATAQGLYLPNAGFQRLLQRDDLHFRPDTNFGQTALSLNHGASQQPWDELKEAYLDIEMFDHHLWLRVGRQTIVWGKTELFRAQDQFNPQDVGLSSLPTLEESRVPLWSTRGVYSFYDVGPFTDVRIEAAMNWDEFKPIDTGRCGEPFAPRAACNRMFGFLANDLVGTGLAGELRPGYPWEDYDALEGGLRLEFRYDRFSYALTWWNGRSDIPHLEPVFVFSRNVDPFSGRPRVEGGTTPCSAPGQPACLGEVVDDPAFGLIQIDPLKEALERHHANLQLFTTICGATVTFSSLLPEACGFNVWNHVEPSVDDPTDPLAAVAPTFSMAFSAALAGQGPNQTVFPAGINPTIDGLRALNGKTILFTLGRFSEYDACGGPCGVDAEDDMPLVRLVDNGAVDYDGVRPSFPVPPNPFPKPDPANSQDDAWFCERLAQRLGPCNVVDPLNTNFNYDFWRPQGMARYLSDAQEALLGCGRYWGTDCDVDGFDLLNSEGSAFFEAWPGIEGTEGGVWDTFGLQNRTIPPSRTTYLQPGTIDATTLEPFPQGPVCSRNTAAGRVTLPGCDVADDGEANGPGFAPALAAPNPQVLNGAPAFQAGHPFTGDPWRSEVSALSWNALMTLVTASTVSERDDDGVLPDGQVCGVDANCTAMNGLNDTFENDGVAGSFDEFNPLEPFALDRCSFRNPILCKALAALLQVSQTEAKAVRAGGNGRFGRRDFVWHGGAQAVLDYQRRNIFGFAMDFAEDRTRTNWNVEFTWFQNERFTDHSSFGLTSGSDTLNLVVSVDRPTFLRPLNKNRTFFLNAQVFIQGIPGWKSSFPANGPVTALMTFSMFTGYYQDRLIPSAQVVYDVNSESGAFLWSLGYRITQNFLLQFGLNAFWGTVQDVPSPVLPVGTPGAGVGRGKGSQRAYVENGLSTVRDRDEIFLRLRWTF